MPMEVQLDTSQSERFLEVAVTLSLIKSPQNSYIRHSFDRNTEYSRRNGSQDLILQRRPDPGSNDKHGADWSLEPTRNLARRLITSSADRPACSLMHACSWACWTMHHRRLLALRQGYHFQAPCRPHRTSRLPKSTFQPLLSSSFILSQSTNKLPYSIGTMTD